MTEDTLKQDIVRRLDRLSPEALRAVRDFAAFLQQKSSSTSVFDQIDASIQAIADRLVFLLTTHHSPLLIRTNATYAC